MYLLQILTIYDALDTLNIEKIVEYIRGLQQDDGSFYGDKWGVYTYLLWHSLYIEVSSVSGSPGFDSWPSQTKDFKWVKRLTYKG